MYVLPPHKYCPTTPHFCLLLPSHSHLCHADSRVPDILATCVKKASLTKVWEVDGIFSGAVFLPYHLGLDDFNKEAVVTWVNKSKPGLDTLCASFVKDEALHVTIATARFADGEHGDSKQRPGVGG